MTYKICYYEDLGFTVVERRGRRYPPQGIADTNFADGIATFSDTLKMLHYFYIIKK